MRESGQAIGRLVGFAIWVLGTAQPSAAVAGATAPVLALRVVDGVVQVGTESPAPFYLQWCTPMGEWENWQVGTVMAPGVPSHWFRGVFEDVDQEDPMQWNPPENVAFYDAEDGEAGADGISWIPIGAQTAEGTIEGLAAPDRMSFLPDPVPVADAPKNNQAVATPDPGRVRLYWQNTSTRQPVIWHLGDSGVKKGAVTVASSPSTAWRIAGTGDIDSDGTEDLVWHNSSSGRVVIWFLDPDGVYNRSQQVLDANLATTWSIKGVEDMNGDGVPDLVWHQSTTGRAYVWALNASGERTSGWDVSETYPATAWKIVGVEDMNGDSNPDLVWHNSSTGRAHIWYLDAAGKYVSGANVADVNLATAWQIKGVEDMNGDTNPDLVWHNSSTGRAHIWYLDDEGKYVSGANVSDSNPATTWKIEGVADVNSDGNPDLVWHNASTGRALTWFLNDSGIYVSATNASSANLATAWQIDDVSY